MAISKFSGLIIGGAALCFVAGAVLGKIPGTIGQFFYSAGVKLGLPDRIAIDEARNSLATQVRDPSSLQLINVRNATTGNIRTICGEFNAKNGFGGYVGFKRFAVYGPALLKDSDQFKSPTIDAICG